MSSRRLSWGMKTRLRFRDSSADAGRNPAGAEAPVDFVDVMRRLKPPTPSGWSSFADCESCPITSDFLKHSLNEYLQFI